MLNTTTEKEIKDAIELLERGKNSFFKTAYLDEGRYDQTILEYAKLFGIAIASLKSHLPCTRCKWENTVYSSDGKLPCDVCSRRTIGDLWEEKEGE